MKIYKIFVSLFLIVIISNLYIEKVFAISPTQETPIIKVGGIDIDTERFNPKNDKTKMGDETKEKVNQILGWINTIASIVSVATLMIIGIKYIVGSIEQKAKYKETLIPYVIGCLMVMGGTNLVTLIYKIFY